VGGVGVHAGLAESPPLAEEVPALVEADLDRVEPLVLGVAQPVLAGSLVELVLLGDELLDAVVDRRVFHRSSDPTGSRLAEDDLTGRPGKDDSRDRGRALSDLDRELVVAEPTGELPVVAYEPDPHDPQL